MNDASGNIKELLRKLEIAKYRLLAGPGATGITKVYGAASADLPDTIANVFHIKGQPVAVPTACTDGVRTYWNPSFLESLTIPETMGVLLHELKHVLHGHMWRFPNLSMAVNMACDYAINGDLDRDKGAYVLPKGALLDHKYDSLSEEEILKRLRQESQPRGRGGESGEGDGASSIGEFSPDIADESKDSAGGKDGKEGKGAKTPQSVKEVKEKWEKTFVKIAQSIEAMRGTMPAGMDRHLNEMFVPEPDWRSAMDDFAKTVLGERNDWSRQNRRMAMHPVIYPRKKADETGFIVGVRDTSCSIDDDTAAEFSAMLDQVLQIHCAEGLLLDVDTEVAGAYNVLRGEKCPRKAKGGGGTCFEPAFEYAEKHAEDNGQRISGLIYFTDLCGSFPEQAPNYPVLWVVKRGTSIQVPFGRKVEY